LLRITGDVPPLTSDHLAILGSAENSEGHEFRSYGYKQLGEQRDGYVEGRIMGPVEPLAGQQLKADPIELRTRDVAPGISGAAVLDVERNLVVGLVARRWNPGDRSSNDNIAWAVDGRVLGYEPFNLPLHTGSLELASGPRRRTDLPVAAIQPRFATDLSRAPRVLDEWVGRAELLEQLDREWNAELHRIIGLVGFGGEGKTSVARQWIEQIRLHTAPPSGVFWWAFYDNSNLDEFYEAVLQYLLGDRIDLAALPSTSMRAHVVASLLRAGRYLIVLDGLEVLQHQSGDSYGEFTSVGLREFLQLFAAPDHLSVCIATSRAPLLDLQDFTTYTEFAVERLLPEDGRTLLRRLGVHGTDQLLDSIVRDWDGHALTLALVATYLLKRWNGHASHAPIDELRPLESEDRYAQVRRVLRRYDEQLSVPERTFMTVFSAFRTPVHAHVLDRIFRNHLEHEESESSTNALTTPIAALDSEAFAVMLQRLISHQILRYNQVTDSYTTHPLIRAHYSEKLEEDPARVSLHQSIKEYYLASVSTTPALPTLDELTPLIEAVHHACRAGAYDEAFVIYQDRIDQGEMWVLTHKLGAHETELALLLEFFPDNDPSTTPQVSNPNVRAWLLNEIGFCLMTLGRLREAPVYFERANTIVAELEIWENACRGSKNVAELYIDLGMLRQAARAADESLQFAHRFEEAFEKLVCVALQAWIAYLRGQTDAGKLFLQSEAIQRQTEGARFLYHIQGLRYAEYLLRHNERGLARQVTMANLALCAANQWISITGRCRRFLGEIDSAEGNHKAALGHFQEAVNVARAVSERESLIEALLARGRWAARWGAPEDAFLDLTEALDYAVQGGYRLYEVDIRLALAWAHRASGNNAAATTEAKHTALVSREMEYHWGIVAAEEVMNS
jgi:tetratricopeptide (TPR) repeat protein